jgi:allantoate deiminase/N-carbamoyl-L-amino-acid hydrolase
MARLERLAACTEDPACLTRTFLTPAHTEAAGLLAGWMTEAGLHASRDAVGNVVGRYEGREPRARALLLGSHFDTVRDAGRYDGTLGIVAAIECVHVLAERGERLDHAVEVIGFADEEGVRFGATLLGSRAIAGTFDRSLLGYVDADGVTMADALRAVGLDPARVEDAARDSREVLAFAELHIEQGPVLLDEGLPVGVVTAVAGASRLEVRIEGLAGHAGTVPMGLRRDAAAAAAEAVLLVERCCSGEAGLVGTVGRLAIPNGATNVIPGAAVLSIDIRAGDDGVREQALAQVLAGLEAIGEKRNVRVTVTRTHDAPAVLCAPWLMARLERAVAARGIAPRRMPSGAGHDAMALRDLTDIAMVFVRCGNGGISHHPDEQLEPEDARVATAVLLDFIRDFEPVQGAPS